MKYVTKILLSAGLLSVMILTPFESMAHPGRTDSSGCHTCRTNCPSWGLSYGEYHCSGGSVPKTTNTVTSPTSNPQPVISPEPEVVQQPDATELQEVTAQVTGITDGDTIAVSIDGQTYKVRLIGIDTPESVDPRKPVECFSKEATEKIKALIADKQITLKRDAVNDNVDVYGRLLRYVYLDGVDVNAEMIKQGYAYAYLKYSFESGKMDIYKRFENEARANEVGLWAPAVCGNNLDEGTVAGITVTNQTEGTAQENNTQVDGGSGSDSNNKTTIPTSNSANNNSTEDDFGGGMVAGIVLTLMGVGGYKLIKRMLKGKRQSSNQ